MGLVKLLTRSMQPSETTFISSSEACHSHHRLITVSYSHYCEKARFALSLSSLHGKFKEEQHLPAFHIPFTLDLRKTQRYPDIPEKYHVYDYLRQYDTMKSKTKEKLSPKELTGVPKMCLNISFNDTDKNNDDIICDNIKSFEGAIVNTKGTDNTMQVPVVIANGSDGIMKYLYHHDNACEHFYPANIKEEVEKLEEFLNAELGIAATDWAFSNMLLTSPNSPGRNEKSLDYFVNELTKLDNKKNSLLEVILFKVFGKSTFLPLMIDSNGVSEERGQLSRKKITAVFDKIDAMLSDRDSISLNANDDNNHVRTKFTYLFGTTKPTAADITLATLAAPILLLDATKENFPTMENMESYIKDQCKSDNDVLKYQGMVEMLEFAAQMKSTKAGSFMYKFFEIDLSL